MQIILRPHHYFAVTIAVYIPHYHPQARDTGCGQIDEIQGGRCSVVIPHLSAPAFIALVSALVSEWVSE